MIGKSFTLKKGPKVMALLSEWGVCAELWNWPEVINGIATKYEITVDSEMDFDLMMEASEMVDAEEVLDEYRA